MCFGSLALEKVSNVSEPWLEPIECIAEELATEETFGKRGRLECLLLT